MHRSAPFTVVVLILLVGSVVLLLLPLSTCPDCDDAMSVHRRVARMPSFVNLGCPRCDESGRVSGFNRWTRRPLDADLRGLIRGAWTVEGDEKDDFDSSWRRLAARSGLRLAPEGEFASGEAVFVDDGKDGVLAASLGSRDRLGGLPCWDLLLFDRDGAVLDQLRVSCLNPPRMGLSPLWSTGGLDCRSFAFLSRGPEQFFFWFQRGAEETRVLASSLRFRARNGRFERDP